jgi:UDP-N-acetylmuramoyl-tripeptide--D-alanyl-D-alanine ligase
MIEAAEAAGMPSGTTPFFDEPQAAGRFLKSIARPGDSILFKGSRGTRVEQALEEFLR